jgi:hypothetical protein
MNEAQQTGPVKRLPSLLRFLRKIRSYKWKKLFGGL